MRKGILSTLLLVLVTVAACGEKDPAGPLVDRSAVAGVYRLVSLSFDPQGSLGKVDIITRLAPADQPELWISRSDNGFQLVFRDPESGLVKVAKGSYTLLESQVRLNFDRTDEAQRLLLPKRIEFDFDRTAMTLSYLANTQVSLHRLRELAPEFRNEQLPDPVLGELAVIFELDRK